MRHSYANGGRIRGVLYCDSRNNWSLHFVQGDEDAVLYFDTKEQIRKALHIHNTKLTSVLSSASNPIDEFIDCIVPPQNESVNLPDKKTYVAKLILKDCDYDLEKVEAKMREFYRKGTSVTALMSL